MEVHRQRCQICQSLRLNNLVTRDADGGTIIYARCADCGELVARYRLRDYYHHGKGVESYLRSLDPGNAESGRRMLAEYNDIQAKALEGFQRALEQLDKDGKPLEDV